MTTWLDGIGATEIQKDGVTVGVRRVINVTGSGATVTDNPVTGVLTIALGSAAGGALAYPYNLQNGVAQTPYATAANKLLLGSCSFNATILPNQTGKTRHAYFEAIIETSNAAQAAYVDLVDLNTNTTVASSQLTTTSLTPVLLSADMTALANLASGLYQARLWMGAQDSAQVVTCLYAALVVRLV